MLSVPNIVGVEYCVLAISWQSSVARNWRAWEPRTITLIPQPLPSISVTTLVVIVAVAEPIKYEPIDVKLIVLLQAVLHSVFPLFAHALLPCCRLLLWLPQCLGVFCLRFINYNCHKMQAKRASALPFLVHTFNSQRVHWNKKISTFTVVT